MDILDKVFELLHDGKKSEAYFFLKKAEQQGESWVFIELATLFEQETCEEFTQDLDKAFYYYNEAAVRTQNIEAYRSLGHYSFEGIGTKKNIFKAIEFWRIASVKGCMISELMLARVYRHGYGIDMDLLKARNHYNLAIAKGSLIGLRERGTLDIRNGRFLKGMVDNLKGRWRSAVLMFNDVYQNGCVTDDRIKKY